MKSYDPNRKQITRKTQMHRPEAGHDRKELLIPKHGGYRKLKSFQVAQLAYDVTVRFCELYVERFSRTRDQMVQAARSGVQNIAEGSQASATSRKTELKLTNVARASLKNCVWITKIFCARKTCRFWRPIIRRWCVSSEGVAPHSRRSRHGLGRKERSWTSRDEHGQARTKAMIFRPCLSVRVRVRPFLLQHWRPMPPFLC